MSILVSCPPVVVTAAVAGDAAALSEVYAAHWRLVYGLALRILRDHHDAEDVAQETFARMLAAIGDYDQRAGVPIGAWLCRIARNAAIDTIRVRARSSIREIPTGYVRRDRDFDAADARLDAHFAARHTVRRMPADWRRVLALKFAGDMQNAEIAAELGRSEGAVKAMYVRCLAALRENAA